jgi:hypothetical protein
MDQSPLTSIGDHRERKVLTTQPFRYATQELSGSTYAEPATKLSGSTLFRNKDRQNFAIRPTPDTPGFNKDPGKTADAPLASDSLGFLPLIGWEAR